jgi:hypothetical protein
MLYANCLYTLYVVLHKYHTRALLSPCMVAWGFLYVCGRGPSCLLGSVRRLPLPLPLHASIKINFLDFSFMQW